MYLTREIVDSKLFRYIGIKRQKECQGSEGEKQETISPSIFYLYLYKRVSSVCPVDRRSFRTKGRKLFRTTTQ